ncbi:pirin family protein [Marinicella sediminis]|uniref:Pirin family protein n=1 Tax=Marinicella sediminis TaxID=1792834 RepID=A0ABV7J3Y2_9GAMM|nr:pirin family protein [Marinicella sediminis]
MTEATIKQLIEPRTKDLGGFSVRRVLPAARQKLIGPWIFFDHMGPAEFPAGTGIDVRPHPHINLATVTYLFEGEILHRDSLGSCATIEPGDINLMVAGSGIVHSERERDEVRNQAHQLHGLQLWLALPEAVEETAPAFYHYDKQEIPGTTVDGVPVRVMMGSAYGLNSPVKVYAETLYIEAALNQGQSLQLPDAAERGLYVAEGQLSINGQLLDRYHMAVLDQGPAVITATAHDTRIAVIGGEVMTRRYIDWNFVSSRPERIAQAKSDWKKQRFPRVPGDEDEYIPLPE